MTSPSVQESSLQTPFSGAQFAFVACQVGAERILKSKFAAPNPASVPPQSGQADFRLAFSRPGLITFKLPSQPTAVDAWQQTAALSGNVLARRVGLGIAHLKAETAEALAEQIIPASGEDFDAVHVFQRDWELPGSRGFEPGVTPLASAVADLLKNMVPRFKALPVNVNAAVGNRVLDVILVEPDQWLIGTHRVEQPHDGWPGGCFAVPKPDFMISRAYLKMAESLAWSQMPISVGDRIVEIGSAPGGSCQRLLDMGLHVTGVDPAEMDPLLLDHPRFEHWRSKAAGLKRKLFGSFKWLAADANVAPNYTLDVVEDIVSYPTSRFAGLLLTLKLTNYELLDELEHFRQRVQGWGFPRVSIRQLSSNRRECCLYAAR